MICQQVGEKEEGIRGLVFSDGGKLWMRKSEEQRGKAIQGFSLLGLSYGGGWALGRSLGG